MRARAKNQLKKAQTEYALAWWIVHAVGGGLRSYGLPDDGFRVWIGEEGDLKLAIAPKCESEKVEEACASLLAAIQAWVTADPSFVGQPLSGEPKAHFERVVTPYLKRHGIDPGSLLVSKTPVL